ncbi:hypothetical protein L1887_62663 [Cichorium endivia]|nr:hypothetical protein L1887_62663 [Cichorium endivia]
MRVKESVVRRGQQRLLAQTAASVSPVPAAFQRSANLPGGLQRAQQNSKVTAGSTLFAALEAFGEHMARERDDVRGRRRVVFGTHLVLLGIRWLRRSFVCLGRKALLVLPGGRQSRGRAAYIQPAALESRWLGVRARSPSAPVRLGLGLGRFVEFSGTGLKAALWAMPELAGSSGLVACKNPYPPHTARSDAQTDRSDPRCCPVYCSLPLPKPDRTACRTPKMSDQPYVNLPAGASGAGFCGQGFRGHAAVQHSSGFGAIGAIDRSWRACEVAKHPSLDIVAAGCR